MSIYSLRVVALKHMNDISFGVLFISKGRTLVTIGLAFPYKFLGMEQLKPLTWSTKPGIENSGESSHLDQIILDSIPIEWDSSSLLCMG